MLINTVHSSHICVRICECPSSMLGVCSPTQILLKLYFYSRMFDSTKTTALPLSVARHRHRQCVVSTAPLHMCLHNVCTQHTFNAMHTAHTQFAKCVNNRGRAREWETKQKKKLKTALIKLLLLNEWVFFFSSVHAMCWVCVCVCDLDKMRYDPRGKSFRMHFLTLGLSGHVDCLLLLLLLLHISCIVIARNLCTNRE